MDRLPGHAAEDERRDIDEAIRLHYRGDRRAPARLVHRAAARSTPCDSWRRRAASPTSPTPMTTTCPIGSSTTGRPQLIIPYTLDANDMRFATPQGFNSGDQFFAYLKDSFDTLYAEGKARAAADDEDRPALPPGRAAGPGGGAEALRRLCASRTTRSGWRGASTSPGTGTRTILIEPAALRTVEDGIRDRSSHTFGGVFEHSPWIAERAFELELGPAHDTSGGLHNALCRIFRSASETERLACSTPIPTLPANWPRPNG